MEEGWKQRKGGEREGRKMRGSAEGRRGGRKDGSEVK
jgi:hypothetical protein